MRWQQWPSVSLRERQKLPYRAGIYVVADANQVVWDVGQAVNLQARWLGKGHHRYPQLMRTNKRLRHRIYWQPVSVHQLDEKERFYRDQFTPELNGAKVNSYLPKQPQVDREIKRLFKVLNKPTLLFPVIRSAVAGAYQDTDGTQCIVVLTFLNDFYLLAKSARKRGATEVRRAWHNIQSDCGKPTDRFHLHCITAYSRPHQRFEFVEGADILRYLEHHPSTYERVVRTTHLVEVEVKTLIDLSVLDEVDLAEAYTGSRKGKRTLKAIAYLNYRRALMKPLQNASERRLN